MRRRKISSDFRIYFLIFLFFLLAAASISRLFFLQIRNHSYYKELANKQHIRERILPAKRGEIFFSDEVNFLAKNQGYLRVAVVPKEIEKPRELAKILNTLLEKEENKILEKISDLEDPWVIIGEIFLDKASEIENIKGVYFESDLKRYYPQNEIASNIIGFYGYDKTGKKRVGQYGIEGYLEKELKGKDGFRRGIVDGKGKEIFSSFNKIQLPLDGAKIILTLDHNIQYFIEEKLKEVVEKYKAEGGTIIVSNPKTGEILAMASLPNFNSNKYNEVEDQSYFRNPAVEIPFEPGSIFKCITLAMALEEKVINPETKYIDSGAIKIDNWTIRNSDNKVYGEKTMVNVLEFSINTGAVFAQQKLGGEKFKEYIQKFGFGEKTNIELVNESKGNIINVLNPPSNKKLIEYANASFGQGIGVTPIQFITAMSAITNQGRMMKPQIIKKIIYSDGKEEEFKPKIIREVISPETASKVTAMMISTIKNGHAKRAEIEGYLIAGKTGTAQIPDLEKGGYLPDQTIHSFVSFAPAFDPKFLLFLKIEKPQGVRYAAESLAPLARDIKNYLFSYYGIEPEK